MSAARPGTPDRRALPPATLHALAHPGARTILKVRLIPAALLLLAVLGCVGGVILVEGHHSALLDDLRTRGIRVTGHVRGVDTVNDNNGPSYYNEVTWSFRGQTLTDDDTMGPLSGDELLPTGSPVPVVIDPRDSSVYTIDGYLADGDLSTGAVGLLCALAAVCAVFGGWFLWSAGRYWVLLQGGPFVTATAALVGTRMGGTRRSPRRVRVLELTGPDLRLPISVTSSWMGDDSAVWVVFGHSAALVCEPGGYRFRRHPLELPPPPPPPRPRIFARWQTQPGARVDDIWGPDGA